MSMEGHRPQLPEDDHDFDMLNIIGDPIQQVFLPLEFFEAVASHISNQRLSFNKLARHLQIGT
jgi:hypothetical protein